MSDPCLRGMRALARRLRGGSVLNPSSYAAGVEVRPVNPLSDSDALSLLDASFATDVIVHVEPVQAGWQLTEVPVATPVTKSNSFAAELTSPDRRWTDGVVAVEGERIVGFAATAYQAWNRRQILWHLYVDRLHRGRGVSRTLLEAVTEIGRRNGARQLWLETQNVNVPAVRAYRALGFQLVGLDTSLYDGDVAHETALYFARPI